MTTALDRNLTWAPRVLTICVAAFLSVIALDVFGEGRPMTWAFFSLAMHLIPSVLVLLRGGARRRRRRGGRAAGGGGCALCGQRPQASSPGRECLTIPPHCTLEGRSAAELAADLFLRHRWLANEGVDSVP